MNAKHPGPGFRDWALFGVSITLFTIGVLMLFDKPREALLPLSLFGVCSLTFGYNIYRKRRRQRFTATTVAVAGGVKLRGSSSRTGLLGVLLAFFGGAVFFIPDAPLFIRICGALTLVLSAWVFFAVLTGRIARRFLRFDPTGLTIGEPSYEYLIPWQALTNVSEFELVHNASVGLTVHDPDAIVVTPAHRRGAVFKGFGNNRALSGFDVVVMAVHFNVPAESLCAAIRNYVQNPEARAELVARPALK